LREKEKNSTSNPSTLLQKKNKTTNQTYEDLLSNLLGLGDSLKRAGAPHDAVMDAAEKLVAVQRASLRRSTALRAEAQGYDPSRFVGRSNENDNGGNGGNGDNEEPGATTTGGGGAGDATDFVGKLAAAERSRRGTRRAAEGGGEDDDDEEDSEVSDDSVAADTPGAGLEQRALDVLNQIREHEYHLHDLRGYAPEQSGRGNDDVMEVRGGGGMRPAATTATVGGGTVVVGTAPAGGPGPGAAAGGHNQALLGGARNARCPLTTKLLADISEPVEDQRGFVYERAAIEQYVLSETAKRVGGRRAGALPPPNSGIEAYPADVVERATSSGVVAPVAGTNHRVALGYLRPARRLLRELAARRAAAGGGGGGGGAFGEGDNGGGAGADADIDISE